MLLLRLKLNEEISRSFIWCIFKRSSFFKSGKDGTVYDKMVIILDISFCNLIKQLFHLC